MIINHISDSQHTVTDTDKLPDIDAMILEQCEELRKLCHSANRPVVIMVTSNDNKILNHYFWNMGIKNTTDEEKAVGMVNLVNDEGKLHGATSAMLTMIDSFSNKFTGGMFRLQNQVTINNFIFKMKQYEDALQQIADSDNETPSESIIEIAKNTLD